MERKSDHNIALVFLHLLLYSCEIKGKPDNEIFQVIPCSNPKYETILRAKYDRESLSNDLIRCASSCADDEKCNFAIFRQLVHSCQHIFSYRETITNSSSTFSYENGCFILEREDQQVSPNGSENGEFFGGLYEERTPEFCTSNTWRDVTNNEYSTINKNNFEIKLIEYQTSTTRVSGINYVAFGYDILRLESHNYLSVNVTAESFEEELKREFNFYTDATDIMTTKKVSMTGEATSFQNENVSYKMMIRENVEETSVIYEQHDTNFTDLTSKLYLGHRLMQRDPTLTSFDKNTGDVVFHSSKSVVGATRFGLISPLRFESKKHVQRQRNVYRGRWLISNGQYKSLNNFWVRDIELDPCWAKISPNLDNTDVFIVLKDTLIIWGREIRLVMSASIATDVTIVIITNQDVIVTLADYFTPADAFTPLGNFSKIRFSTLSLSKSLAECDMAFESDTVHRVSNRPFPSSTEWIVSLRKSVVSLVVTSTGTVQFGSHIDVYSDALNGRTIRVCVKKTIGFTCCFNSVTLNLDDESRHVIAQSPVALDVRLNPDGTYSGVGSSDCRRRAYLVSTKGWVKSTSFVIGTASPPNAVSSLDFLTITWFSQK